MVIWTKRLVIGLLGFGAFCFVGLWVTSKMLEPVPIGPADAPDPASFKDAVVQVYGADVWGVRGHFAIHTWVATKAVGASTYDIYQVIGWRLRRTGRAVDISKGLPDRPWFRSAPILLHEIKGEPARALIEPIRRAVSSYPFHGEYTMWPGPNSNSFTQWIAMEVPELQLSLPTKAIGAGWMRSNYDDVKAEG
ncbi:MAG: DUF3750 domain-containing protein [Pseudomonadota bacterium]